MNIVLAGTGTSHGIPVIACTCPVCTSSDSRDTRNRTGAFITADDGTVIIIDVSPEFRLQALRFTLTKVDAVLLTHSHADHLHGLDDLRIFAHTWNPTKVTKQSKASKPLCIYANAHTLHDVQNRFDYVFTPTREGGGKPNLSLCCADAYTEENPLVIGCLSVVGVPIRHGSLEVCGWKITDTTTHCSFAYITDCNYICDESVRLIHGVEHCVLDSLRKEKHSTHFCFSESLEYAQRIEANNTWITHICHDFSHAEISEWFTQHNPTDKPIQPAYDGLTLTC